MMIIWSAEQQSVASADRKGDQKQGKKPDVMFMECSEKKFHKLILVESSCIVCTKIKEENDSVKLWREMNNKFHMEKFQSEDEILIMVHRTIHKKGNRSVIEVPFSTEPLDIRRVIWFYWTFCVILFTTFDEIMYCIFKEL
ncbi:hypothetical protein RhiirB3_388566 [Rhizophagus irregularis]|nr:hypothetical protein RhiirB3_388566 [Rhizophagus irregularis]